MAPDRAAELAALAEPLQAELQAAHTAREAGLSACRRAIRASGLSIRAVHRGHDDDAAARLDEARDAVREAQEALRPHPAVAHAGFLHDAEKEYVEAMATAALLSGSSVPGPSELRVGDPAWLNGLAEAIGEMRRFLLDRLREGDLERGEELLEAMDDIHDLLASLDYPDALTSGLRRSTDVARSILERTRGDLTASAVQSRLTRALEARAGE